MKPLGEAREVGPGTVVYLSGGHSSEGGHEVALNGRRLRVLPDGRTTARQRSQAITAGLQAEPDPLHSLIGHLIHYGASHLALDGVPLTVGDSTDRVLASLRLEVSQDERGVGVRVVETGGH